MTHATSLGASRLWASGLCALALVLAMGTAAFAQATATVTVASTSFTYPSPPPSSGVAFAVPPGDTFQIPFSITNDTNLTVTFDSIVVRLTSVNSDPSSEFSSLAAAHLQAIRVHTSSGVQIGSAAFTGAGNSITVVLTAPQNITSGSTGRFFLCIPTSASAPQVTFEIEVKTTSAGGQGGVWTSPVRPDTHILTSEILQIVRPKTSRVGEGRYAGGAIVGANSGPFELFEWIIRNKTKQPILYKGMTITCTNVRGFVPGAIERNTLLANAFTGDIEKFVTNIDGSTNKNFTRRGTSSSNHLRDWSTPAPTYRIYIPVKKTADDEVGDLGEDDPIEVSASGSRTFQLHYHTNAYMSDIPAPGGVVPGDVFYASLDTLTLFASTGGTGAGASSWVGNTNVAWIDQQTSTPQYLVMASPTANYLTIHPHLDATSSTYNDGADLDYLTYRPLFGIQITGGPSNTQGIRAIRLKLTHRPGVDFNSETSPLRRIDQTEFSGFQIRRTDDKAYSNSDQIYPLDVSQTLITPLTATTTRVDLVVSGYVPLPTEQDIGSVVARADRPRVWIGIEPSVHAAFGDSLIVEIETGGIQFLSGLTVYDSHPQSFLNGTDNFLTSVAKLGLPLNAQQSIYPLNDTASVTFGTPVIFRDLTASGQSIAPSSQPTAILGLNVQDSAFGLRLGEAVFFVFDGVPSGGGAIGDNDFAPLSNNETSGWAIYRDNDQHPNNTNGTFDPGIDSFVRFTGVSSSQTRYVPVGNPYDASTLSNFGAGNQPLMIRLEFDSTVAAALVPPNDLGVNAGDDFFLVTRTSATITPGDKFRVVLGDVDPNKPNSYDGGIRFDSSSGIIRTVRDRVFSSGDIYRLDSAPYHVTNVPLGNYPSVRASDNMRSELLSVTGGIAVNVNNLIIGQKNVFRGNEVALFGLNAVDTSGGIAVISFLVAALDSGVVGNFDTKVDLAPFLTSAITKGYGLTVYQDNGPTQGSFDTGDSVVSGNWSVDSVVGSTTFFKFTFSPAWDIPDTDQGTMAGNDLFVVTTLSDSLVYKDDFAFRIPENAFVFAPPGVISQPPPVTTGLLMAGMPSRILDLPDSGTLPTDGTRVAVLGFNAVDETSAGSGGVLLDRIRVRLDDPTAPGGFPFSILKSLTSDSSSGISVWVDKNGNRAFDDNLSLDSCLTATFAYQSANIVDITVLNANAAVPDTDPQNLKSDTAAVFFLVLRASSDGLDRQVQVSIQATTEPLDPWVKYTAPTDRALALTSNVLTISPPGVSGSFTPLVFSPNGDGITDTIRVTISADTLWSLSARKISSGVSQTIATDSGDTNIVLAASAVAGNPRTYAWPSDFVSGGAFNLSFTYNLTGTTKTYDFGDTLLVDLFCTAPILTSTLPAVVTSGNTVAISISADTNRSGPDAFALTAGESAAQYYIYRMDGSVATLAAPAGNLVNYAASNISVSLQGGSNQLVAILRDAYGNWSDTRTLGTVTLSVGSNRTIVDNIVTDPAKLWLGKGDSVAVLGINVTQDLSNEAIAAFTLQVFDSGAFAYGQNIANVLTSGAYTETGGILVYRDNPTAGTKGLWDTQDILVPMNPPQRNATYTSGDTIRFIPQTPMPVPEDDTQAANQGYDYFIVVQGGGGRYFRDSFVLSMPANTAFEFATSSLTRSNLSSRVTTSPLLTRVPRAYIDRTTVNDSMKVGSEYVEIFGVNVSDTTRNGDAGAAVSSIRLDFSIASGDTFNPAILSYQVYRDSGSTNVGYFDRTVDSPVATAVTYLSPTSVLLTLSGGNAAIPADDSGHDSGADFWIAVRPNVISLSLANRFTVSIPQGGVVTTGDSPGGPGVTASKQVSVPAGGLSSSLSPNPFSPDGDGKFDTTGYTISFGDTRSFRLRVVSRKYDTVIYDMVRSAKDTVVVLAFQDSSTLWRNDEYLVVLTDLTTGDVDTQILYADTQALVPVVTSKTTSGSILTLAISVTERSNDSVDRAWSSSEKDSFAIIVRTRTATHSETSVTVYSSLVATTPITPSITLYTGTNEVSVVLQDKVGNEETTTFSISSTASTSGTILYDAPVFRYTPSNTTFRFSFPTTVTGGTLEFYNISGERVRLINLTPGLSYVDWNAANDAAQLLRNGVYVAKFKVPLSDGRTIEEARTIFLLK